MEKYIIEVGYYDYDLDLEEEFYGENDFMVIINGLKRYKGINDNLTTEEVEEYAKGKKVYTISAYIHSGISFRLGDPKDAFDSGYAGYVIAKEDLEEDIIDYQLEKLNHVYNGWVKDISVYKLSYCECCGNEKEREHITSALAFSFEDEQAIINDFKKEFKTQQVDYEKGVL